MSLDLNLTEQLFEEHLQSEHLSGAGKVSSLSLLLCFSISALFLSLLESVTLTAFEETMFESEMLPVSLTVVIQNRYNKHLGRQYYLGIQSLLTDIGR